MLEAGLNTKNEHLWSKNSSMGLQCAELSPQQASYCAEFNPQQAPYCGKRNEYAVSSCGTHASKCSLYYRNCNQYLYCWKSTIGKMVKNARKQLKVQLEGTAEAIDGASLGPGTTILVHFIKWKPIQSLPRLPHFIGGRNCNVTDVAILLINWVVV